MYPLPSQTLPIPRKGTETYNIFKEQEPKQEQGQTLPIPRKGTETSNNSSSEIIKIILSDPTNSPQGDGNLNDLIEGICKLFPFMSDPTNSPQGDGNF